MKIYSPSQTLEWSRCPFLWATSYKKGWRSDTVDNRDLAASLGSAFGAGMEVYNREAMRLGFEKARVESVAAAVGKAVLTLQAEWDRWEKIGLDRGLLAGVGDGVEQMTTAVRFAIEHDPTPLDWVVEFVEFPMSVFGNARADVVYKLPTGERVVRDYKFALSVPAKYVDDRMAEYAVHPQSYHYAWMHDATLFIPTLIIASPRPSLRELPTQRTLCEVAQWLTSQQVKWGIMEQMEAGLLQVWKSDIHKNQYGKCSLYDFCLTYEGDESRLPGIGFVKIEKTKTL